MRLVHMGNTTRVSIRAPCTILQAFQIRTPSLHLINGKVATMVETTIMLGLLPTQSHNLFPHYLTTQNTLTEKTNVGQEKFRPRRVRRKRRCAGRQALDHHQNRPGAICRFAGIEYARAFVRHPITMVAWGTCPSSTVLSLPWLILSGSTGPWKTRNEERRRGGGRQRAGPKPSETAKRVRVCVAATQAQEGAPCAKR